MLVPFGVKTQLSILNQLYLGDKQHNDPQQVRSFNFGNSFWHLMPLVSKNGLCNPCCSVGYVFCGLLSDIFKATKLFTLPSN